MMITSFDQYQYLTNTTAVYPGSHDHDSFAGLMYTVLGLNGEAGEIAEKVKKIFRDSEGVVSDESRQAIRKECGDVLWYLAQVCTRLGLDMSDVASANIEKLQSRKQRGVLQGSGDDR